MTVRARRFDAQGRACARATIAALAFGSSIAVAGTAIARTAPSSSEATTTPADDGATARRGAWRRPPVPPRIDGTYVGAVVFGAATLARVNTLDAGPSPFAGAGGHARVGQMVLPWLGLGLSLGGSVGYRSEATGGGIRQRLAMGQLLVEGTFLPVPKLPLSLRAGFGFGGGAVRQAGVSARSGFGGAAFTAVVRYEWFPFARRYRPDRGGGFGVGPELGWIGATPAARGRPMANVLHVAIAMTFYFGS